MRGRTSGLVALIALLAALSAGGAGASDTQPRPDITKMDYSPIGFYEPGDPIPSPDDPPDDPNPSGKWVAYDTNIWETLNLPSRHPGDTSANDPRGSGDPRHGFCPPGDPSFTPWGVCANHQLEYLDYFERTMEEILGDFGVVVHRYEFTSPGTGSRGLYLDAAAGRAFNISATVPGADHPDETVLVSGHYDFTDSGPAAAWDSAEGHTIVIRIAKIMADYWHATGTRPSATVKFIPWDSEESGTWGSIDYVRNNIPPGEEGKVRGYFNMDPCAGAYPAFRNGNPAERVPEVMQLANPEDYDDPEVRARIERFNARAEGIVDEVFDHLDDRLETAPGQPEIFVSDAEAAPPLTPSQRGEIVTAVGGLIVFTSDYANFAALGIPIFNLFPDYFGPHADGTPGRGDGAGILHTPRDNLTTINALTSADAGGLTASEGWAKGMEMCAHIEGWYMLQPEMGGAQRAGTDPVAYYEALPNEAIVDERVRFDAGGSYQYASATARSLVPDSDLRFTWDFGDGTSGTGRVAEHAYRDLGRYETRLTVRNVRTGAADTMELPVTVVASTLLGPVLEPLPARDDDGRFTLAWDFEGETRGLTGFSVEQSTDLRPLLSDDAEGEITRLWTPSETGDAQLHPWQRSEGSPAVNGNKRHSGEASWWTGAFPTAPSPTSAESVLTLTKPLAVPRGGRTTLLYWSLFQSEGDDQGRVEIALDDGDPGTQPRWQVVDGTVGLFAPVDAPPHPEHLDATPEQRRVDLSRFRGQKVLIRFRYLLGPDDRALSQPAGWYVDDVRIETGRWTPAGRTGAAARTFGVRAKAAGTYSYRVLATYPGAVKSAPSNAETIKVLAAASSTDGAGRQTPGTGVWPDPWIVFGILCLATAAALARWVRLDW